MQRMTADQLHHTMIRTHRFLTGYDLDEVDELLEQCENTLRLQEQMIVYQQKEIALLKEEKAKA